MGTFHMAILENDAKPAAATLKTNPKIAPERQMGIYIEGYRIRLTQAIRSDYPTLLALLGEKEFDRLALLYIESNPPTHFNLDRYPHAFAAFVHDSLSDDFTADVAALEGAIAQVFMMDDSTPLPPVVLGSVTPESFGKMTLNKRNASCLLELRYPADTYMEQLRDGLSPARPEPAIRYLYLVRHDNEVKRHPLSHAQHLILSQLCESVTVGEALDAIADQNPDLVPEIAAALPSWFAYWITNGFFMEQ
jgi:hypothetical protein